MDMKEEIMNDAIDDAMEDEADEEERYMIKLFVFFFSKKVETYLLNTSNIFNNKYILIITNINNT